MTRWARAIWATAVIRFNGTVAYPLAPQGQGVQMLMDGVINCSRVHNAMAAAGVMRRALMETLCWDTNRVTFNKPLIQRTIIQKRILDIQTEWLAGCALAFEASRVFEETRADATRKPYARIVTALAKYRTAERAMWCMHKAMEMVGGNGLMETHPLARLNRDAHVLTLWEGPELMQAKLELMSKALLLQNAGRKGMACKSWRISPKPCPPPCRRMPPG